MAAFSLGRSLLEEGDVLEAVLEKMDAAALCQLKAASVAWCNLARRELCNRLWVEPSCRVGQPKPAGVDSITDLDVECLNEAGRPWEVVVAGRQLPQLARLHGWGFVVDVLAVREADLEGEEDDDDDEEEDDDDDEGEDDDGAPLGGVVLRSCILPGEGDPPDELVLATVACAASGTVRGVPVQWLRVDDAIDALDLEYSDIGVTGATLLRLMLPAATSLRSLNLARNQLCGLDHLGDGTSTEEGINKLCEGLKGSSVTSLNLESNGIGHEGASALAAVLKETQIQELCLYFNGIGPEGASALAAVLKETQITDLNLNDCGIGDKGATALAAILKETQITHLFLVGNELGPNGVIALAEGLRGNTTLQELNLINNRLCPKGAAALANGLKGNCTLQSLDIGGNRIGDEGASALAAILKETKITTLGVDGHALQIDELKGTKPTEKINLSRKGLGLASAIIIASCIKGNGVLKELNIANNNIGAEGASALAAILKETMISNLNLQGCVLRPGGGAALAEGLKGNSTLQSLNISCNILGPEGAAALAEGLKGNSTLQSLDLRSNGLNDEAKQAIQDAAGSGVRIYF